MAIKPSFLNMATQSYDTFVISRVERGGFASAELRIGGGVSLPRATRGAKRRKEFTLVRQLPMGVNLRAADPRSGSGPAAARRLPDP
jgi:hypothetical protein